jgi:phage replication-related protein YjqB (UPF0714/DUF867 family)
MPYSCSMTTDKYTSFAELRGSEPKASFAIDVEARPESHVIVIAPHGGKIEVLTSEIAWRIAGSDFSYYSFTGARPDHNRDLHITSHRFDEPRAVALVAKHQWVVAIHGCRGDMPRVLLGGLDLELVEDVSARLTCRDIDAQTVGHPFEGKELGNICNRGATGRGLQIELTMPFREGERVDDLINGVREALMWRRAQ